ncbi:hypothetical protein AMAG_10463 [Allomyces macrogynus ATCC 38327]|uniref:Uncharacterized protein n=1 Tax=Allomyces macrogynus (strain ATCC 38327) TaxID=578462 RepID=A0A0L0SV09_ALLM3|nr:hypothetical protein AMAG_10463 [Allomyces macrogynus ATCC 38327]|eukprot:KNE66225.1 hypothetical protein AMAG_10463 [Allomyces macrogynus ATCC 38327]
MEPRAYCLPRTNDNHRARYPLVSTSHLPSTDQPWPGSPTTRLTCRSRWTPSASRPPSTATRQRSTTVSSLTSRPSTRNRSCRCSPRAKTTRTKPRRSRARPRSTPSSRRPRAYRLTWPRLSRPCSSTAATTTRATTRMRRRCAAGCRVCGVAVGCAVAAGSGACGAAAAGWPAAWVAAVWALAAWVLAACLAPCTVSRGTPGSKVRLARMARIKVRLALMGRTFRTAVRMRCLLVLALHGSAPIIACRASGSTRASRSTARLRSPWTFARFDRLAGRVPPAAKGQCTRRDKCPGQAPSSEGGAVVPFFELVW